MARRTTLVQLLTDLRAETRASLNPAHNAQVRDTHINMLQRTQERLWDEFTWPHLRVERQIPLAAGQRYYDMPANLNIDRIEKTELFVDGRWRPLSPGVGGEHYSAYNSDLDARSWPPRRWKIAEGPVPSSVEQVELWPISNQNADATTREGYLKFTGIRNLQPLTADDHRADLDDRIIVLYAAAELLAASGAKDASLKLDAANRLYARLRSGLTPRRQFRMFGVGDRGLRRGRPTITQYRPAGS
ncbi:MULTISPECIES: phage adaptor protein [unclassified Aurantimonas]|uniref:phage adaptor protein n=1 Tax=unclassified Aurantimonas TaxID=2638230 RepID=UPI002E1797A7|nr:MULTISPECIES: hypothetical protein [unclassified Aurantimonas]MEC5291589.1 hypothetical protein [Aurantimonas sp. C2-3-R2]MEC5412673.1 hypothetical protein [Aurantimonas sp. C2-4-R8]